MTGDFNKDVIEKSIKDIKVELDDEFDSNFDRKSFFDEQQWPERKFDDGKGSLMNRTGTLRRSIGSKRRGGSVVYTSTEPYARIHNEGGEIKVTQKMKRYFRYRYYKEVKKKRGEGGEGKQRRELTDGGFYAMTAGENLSDKAAFWRAMALKKVGSSIVMPERRFIGMGRNTDRIIREITEKNLEDFMKANPIITLK